MGELNIFTLASGCEFPIHTPEAVFHTTASPIPHLESVLESVKLLSPRAELRDVPDLPETHKP